VRKLFAIGLAMALSAPLGAQPHPSFAGSWASGWKAENLAGVVGPEAMTITQDAGSLRVERRFSRNRVTVLVKLDGSRSVNSLDPGPIGRGQASTPRELASQAVWEGAKLKISTTYAHTINGKKLDVLTVETLSLEGSDLLVERVDELFGVPSSTRAGNEGLKSTRVVYKRVAK
jgi:hypothetical protein